MKRTTQIRVGAILLICLGLMLLAAVLSSFGGVASDDVAKVGDAGSISKSEFNRWFVIVASQPQPGQKTKPAPPKPGTKEYDAVKQQVMTFLLSAKWIEGEAAERGITVTDEEVDRQFKQTKDQSFPNEKAYQRFLKSSGQAETDLKFRVRLDALSNKIREQVTADAASVSDSQVEKYYNDNKQQFEQPERRDVEVVKVKTQADAQKALKRVESGDNFKVVAKDVSIDPASKSQGGRLIAVSKGQQEAAFDAAIFSATKNKIVGPIKTDTGYYIFKVTKVTPGSKQGLDQAKAGIKQLLASQNQQKQLDSFATGFRAKWRAESDCADAYLIADCRNGREQTQQPATPPGKQPVKGSTGAAPPALDGTGEPLVGINTGGTAIGIEKPAPVGGLPGQAVGGASAQPAPLALGGAPKEGASALPGGVPGGVVPGGAAPQGGAPQGGTATPGGQ